MSTYEDPIFDPWWIEPSTGSVEANAETESGGPDTRRPMPSRWRSRALGVPAKRPTTHAMASESVAAIVPPRPLEATSEVVDSVPTPAAVDLMPRAPSRAQVRPDPAVSVIAVVYFWPLLLDEVRELAHRLELARHSVVIDDRSLRAPACVRFRITPWRGPFDAERIGSVIEFSVDDESLSEVITRLWLDPMQTEPSDVRAVPLIGISVESVRRLLMEFVEKALRYG